MSDFWNKARSVFIGLFKVLVVLLILIMVEGYAEQASELLMGRPVITGNRGAGSPVGMDFSSESSGRLGWRKVLVVAPGARLTFEIAGSATLPE